MRLLFVWITIFLLNTQLLAAMTLSGTVRNRETNETVAGALVRDDCSSAGSVSNEAGFFRLFRPDVPCTLTVEHVAFERKRVTVVNEQALVIYLQPRVLPTEPITVTANRLPMLARDVAASMTVLSEEDLQRTAGTSLADVVQGVAGTSQRQYGPDGSIRMMSIRGAPAQHTLVLLDGLRISSEQNGTFDGGLIPLELLDQVEIYKSGNSAVYGADAMAGLINITTRMPQEPLYRFGAGLGSFGQRQFSARVQPKLSGVGRLSLSVLDERSDGDFTYSYRDEKRQRHNADYHRQHALLNYRQQTTTGLTVHSQVLWQTSEAGVPDQVKPGQTPDAPGARQGDDNVLGQVQVSQQVRPTVWLEASVFGQLTRQDYTDPTLNFGGSAVDSHHETEATGLRLDGRLTSLSRHTIRTGYEFRYSQVRSTETVSAQRRQHSLFVLDVVDVPVSSHIQMSLQPAARLDFFSDFGLQFSPRLGILAQLEREMTVGMFANVGRNFRAPTFNDMYWETGGNPDLQPEHALNTEIGFRLGQDRYHFGWQVQIALFDNRVEDQIVWQPRNQVIWQPQNVREVRIRGGELSARVEALRHIQAQVNYTRTQSRQHAPGEAVHNKQLIYMPEETLNLQLGGQWQRWTGQLSGHYESHRYTTVDNATSLAPFWVWNATLSRTVTLGERRLTLKFDLMNLFNRTYESVKNYPMPGRHFRVRLAVSL